MFGDEKIHQLTLSTHLRQLVYLADNANIGCEAIVKFSSTNYDLAFIEV